MMVDASNCASAEGLLNRAPISDAIRRLQSLVGPCSEPAATLRRRTCRLCFRLRLCIAGHRCQRPAATVLVGGAAAPLCARQLLLEEHDARRQLAHLRLELGDAPVLSALLDSRRSFSFCGEVLQGLRGPRRFDAVIVRAHRYPRPPSSPPDKAKTFVEMYESKHICGGTSPRPICDLADARDGQND